MGSSASILVIKALAVVGGAVVGWGVVAGLLRLLGLAFSSRGVPRPVVRTLRLLGAVAAGWAAWALLFSGEGGGWGGGGGWLPGGQGGAGTGKEVAGPTGETQPTAPSTARSTPGGTLQVIMLGGDLVQGDRFYALDGEKPMNLAELKAVIKDREQRKGIGKVEILIYDESVAERTQQVRDLKRWAEQNNLQPVTVHEKGDLRERVQRGS